MDSKSDTSTDGLIMDYTWIATVIDKRYNMGCTKKGNKYVYIM